MTMKNRVMAACAVVCTLSVLSMICLGQIRRNCSLSENVMVVIEVLTDSEQGDGYTCYDSFKDYKLEKPWDPFDLYQYKRFCGINPIDSVSLCSHLWMRGYEDPHKCNN